jgi:hypothetical protein
VLSVAAVLLVAYGIYNAFAVRAYLRLRDHNLQLVEQRMFPETFNGIHAFTRSYRLSLVQLDIPTYRASLYRLEQAFGAPPPVVVPSPATLPVDSGASE